MEVTTRDGQQLVAESLYARGTGAVTESRLTDDELTQKFIANVTTQFTDATAKSAAERLWKLEELADVTGIIDALTGRAM